MISERKVIRMEHPKILIAGAECTPFAKTGGLADVIGTLPAYLNALGADARVILPFHSQIKEKLDEKARVVTEFQISVGWRNQYVGIRELVQNGVTYYFTDNDAYFGGPIYRGGEAEGEQYAYFSRAVLEAATRIGFFPDIIHCNDWHTAVIPMLIKTQYQDSPQGNIKTLLTIHNMMYQGQYRPDFVKDVLGVSDWLLAPEYMGKDGAGNFMKAGLSFADKINTVSPSYAAELREPYYAYGLEGILNYRADDLTGIVNGIDNDEYDPLHDGLIDFPFDARSTAGKTKNKEALLGRLGLLNRKKLQLISMVTRLTPQKGIDLVLRVIHEIMQENVAFILLGTGDADYENCFRELEEQYKGRLCAYIGYNNALSHQIYAGSDLFLMPSKFEPCGISQMIAQRYGTLPIVRETGGLRDTVVPYNEVTGDGDGFSFTNYNAHDMLHVIRYALHTIADGRTKRRLMAHAMRKDHSFSRSAEAYLALYHEITDRQ